MIAVLFKKVFPGVLFLGTPELALADYLGGAGSVSSRLVNTDAISKVSANVFWVRPGSLALVRGVDVTARNYVGPWSGNSSETLSLNALSASVFAVVPWTEQFSNMIVVGASGFERGFSRVRAEGVVHATYKTSAVLKWTAFTTWEAGTYSDFPFFIDLGFTYSPRSDFSFKVVVPAAIEARWTSSENPIACAAFFKTGRELSYSMNNEGRLPGANGILDVGRRGWKLGAGLSYRAFGGEVSAEGGAMVLQKLKVESRGRTVESVPLGNAPFAELALRFPAFAFY